MTWTRRTLPEPLRCRCTRSTALVAHTGAMLATRCDCGLARLTPLARELTDSRPAPAPVIPLRRR